MEKSCGLCHQPLNPDDPDNWKEVKGWVGGPKQDSMRLRESTGRLAHSACVLAVADGQAPGAPDIFTESTQSEEQVRTSDRVQSDDPINDFFESGN